MSDLLDEVKQDLSEERLLDAIKKLLPIIAVFFITFIAGYSIKNWWTSYHNDKIYQDGSTYLSSMIKMRTGNVNSALESFEKISSNDSNYAALSNLNIAAHASFKKDFVKAITVYEFVAENSSYSKTFRDFAKMQLVSIQLESEKISADEALTALKSISRSESDFGSLADELRLNLLLTQGKLEDFKLLHAELITDPTVPATIKNRIKELTVLG